uniref:Uncharacterized protein n=1 Tax=Moniliophthora roreri TaxID=221103 RepID=A0A0W0FQK2_MONRR
MAILPSLKTANLVPSFSKAGPNGGWTSTMRLITRQKKSGEGRTIRSKPIDTRSDYIASQNMGFLKPFFDACALELERCPDARHLLLISHHPSVTVSPKVDIIGTERWFFWQVWKHKLQKGMEHDKEYS